MTLQHEQGPHIGGLVLQMHQGAPLVVSAAFVHRHHLTQNALCQRIA